MNEVIEAPSLPASISIRNYVMRFGLHRLHTVPSSFSANMVTANSSHDSWPCIPSNSSADTVVFVPENQNEKIFCNKPSMKCHIQVGLVVAIGRSGFDIEAESAFDHVFGYATGLQVRLMEEQDEHCSSIEDESSVSHTLIGPITAASRFGYKKTAKCALSIKGEIMQSSGSAMEISRTISHAIANLSKLSELKSGDLVFVGALEQTIKTTSGDVFAAEVDNLGKLCATAV